MHGTTVKIMKILSNYLIFGSGSETGTFVYKTEALLLEPSVLFLMLI